MKREKKVFDLPGQTRETPDEVSIKMWMGWLLRTQAGGRCVGHGQPEASNGRAGTGSLCIGRCPAQGRLPRCRCARGWRVQGPLAAATHIPPSGPACLTLPHQQPGNSFVPSFSLFAQPARSRCRLQNDPLRRFYTSLREQRPDSEMAAK